MSELSKKKPQPGQERKPVRVLNSESHAKCTQGRVGTANTRGANRASIVKPPDPRTRKNKA